MGVWNRRLMAPWNEHLREFHISGGGEGMRSQAERRAAATAPGDFRDDAGNVLADAYRPVTPAPKQRRARKPDRTRAQQLRRQFSSKRSKLRKAVFKRDGRHCAECGSTLNLTLDHRVPLHRGGTNDLDNLQVLCGPCNNQKGNRMPGGAA